MLVVAGEAIFVLPFVLARIFRPTFLAAFDLNNLELGLCFSVYGIIGMVSYFLGGGLADKYPAGRLMGAALVSTAVGGFYMATFPSYFMMKVLFGYWGFTTIFLFWAALIKATRQWGGDKSQGKAFGILDGGRGLVAAGIGVLGLFLISQMLGENVEDASLIERQAALKSVVISSSSFVLTIGLIIFLFFKIEGGSEKSENTLIKNYIQCLRIPSVYLLMLIIMCAYVGYKITGIFPQFAQEVMNYNDVESAELGTLLLFLRAIGAVLFGFLADRSNVANWLIVSFILIGLGSALISLGWMDAALNGLFIISVLLAGVGVYAARALYFAAMKEGNIPLALTGTAVGLMSVIGYTPDIFVGPLTGYMLDANPGEVGHQMVFGLLAGFALLGLIASLFYRKITRP